MYCQNLSCDFPVCWANRNDTAQEPCKALQLDADITGSGVIAAYIISAGLTILVMLIAYFSDSLPDEYLEYYDKKVILKSTGVPRFMPWFQGLNRNKRITIFQDFMLAISDQQLITGFAMLVSSLVLRCQLSALDYTIATSLAWFSSTVHLLTLSVLRSYFRKHTAAFITRIIVMWTIYTLLCWASYVPNLNSALGQYPGVPVDCLAQSLDSFDRFHTMTPLVFLGLFLMVATLKTIGPKLASSHTTSCTPNSRFRFLNLLNGKILKHKMVFEEAWLLRSSNRRRSCLEITGKIGILHKYVKGPIYFCNGSFLGVFSATIFVFACGLANTFSLVLINCGIPTVTNSSVASFGQLLPLILLALPHLSAIEAFFELRDDEKENVTQDLNITDLHMSNFPAPVTQTRTVTSTPELNHPPHESRELNNDRMIDQQFLDRLDSIKKFCYKEYTAANGNSTSNIHIAKKQELLSKLEGMKKAEEVLWKHCGHFSITQQGIIVFICGNVGALFGLSTSKNTYSTSYSNPQMEFIIALCVMAIIFSILLPWLIWFVCMGSEIRQSRLGTVLPTQSIASTGPTPRIGRPSTSEIVGPSSETLSLELKSRETRSSNITAKQRPSTGTENEPISSVPVPPETEAIVVVRRQPTASSIV